MIIRELLGTVSEHGRVHLAHDAPDHRADERTTGCTDNGASPLAITAVIGVVAEDSHEALLAIVHALDIHPDSLCRRCFGSWVREPYRRQWTARTSPPAADLDTVVVDARLSACITSISATVADDPDRRGVVDGFGVRVGGGTSRRFVEVANAAARATVSRLGWRGATRSTVTVRGDEALAAYVYRPSDSMNSIRSAGRPLPKPCLVRTAPLSRVSRYIHTTAALSPSSTRRLTHALYEEKHTGRNRVCVATVADAPPPKPVELPAQRRARRPAPPKARP